MKMKLVAALLAGLVATPALASAKILYGQQALESILMVVASKDGQSGQTVFKRLQGCQLNTKRVAGDFTMTISTESGDVVDMPLMKTELAKGFDANYSEDEDTVYATMHYRTQDQEKKYKIDIAANNEKTDIAIIEGKKKNGLFGGLIKDIEYKTVRIECHFKN